MTFEALRAELTRRTTSDDRPGAGTTAHPLADLRRLAARLHGTSEVAGDARFESRDTPSLEAMTSQAADVGLEVTYAVRSVRSLEPADLPCVALLKDGTSRVVLEILPRGRVRIEEAGVEHEVDRASLDALHSGTIFRVRRAPATAPEASGPATAERDAGPAAAAQHGATSLAAMVLRQSVRQAPGLFGKLALAAALSNVLLLALPLFTMAVYDRVVPHFALETLWALAIGVCLALVLDIAIRFVRLKLVDAVALDTSLSLQARLYRTILKMRMSDAPKTSGGLATNVRELDLVCQTVPPIFVSVLIDLPFFLAIVGLLALLGGWPIAGAPIVGIAVLAAASIAIRGFTSGSHVESAVLVRQQANQMIETVGALEWVKATNAEHRLLGRWERLADAAAFASHRGRLWSGMSAQLGATVTQLVIVAVVILGVYQIGAGAMTVGALTACTLLVGRAIAPLVQLIAYLDRLAHLAHVSEALEKLFAAPPEAGGDSALGARRPVRGRFDLTNVAFTYPGDSRPTLDEVTLSIGPGERVGIIGRVGSGKSTLLRLFLRLHEPTKGTMLLDGSDIRQVPPHWLRGAVGFMRQDPVLFDDTLLANLTFGLEHVPDRDVEEAARISGVKDIAARHPKGYSMPVGPRGERLSGGERQAIALARALVANPAVLILDEPTAAMDNGLEARVVRDLRQATAGKTVIVATHRAPVLQLCDRVIWLDGGRVIADGPRDEVLRKLSAA